MRGELERVRAAAIGVCKDFAPQVELTELSAESEGRYQAFIRVRRNRTMSDEEFWPLVRAVTVALERVPGIERVYHEVQMARNPEGPE